MNNSTEINIITPFQTDSFLPYLSETAIKLHLLHHEAYLNNYKRLIIQKNYDIFADMDLESVLMKLSYELEGVDFGPIQLFQNAAQIWNHNFFWSSLAKDTKPSEKLMAIIESSYGTMEDFRAKFIETAMSSFGSCWVWIVAIDENMIDLMVTSNADSPRFSINTYQTTRDLIEQDDGVVPLIACDVWEHAFYPDYQNRKKEYVEKFFDHLINWDFAEKQLDLAYTVTEEAIVE